MKRMPELDSLRALAAIVVMVFHLDPIRYFPGWSGVDLFFVLSGYLITSIIVKNADSPGFFLNFYARRSLRIWPIYYLTVVALVAANPFLPTPAPLADLPYVLTYTQNISVYWGKQPPQSHPALEHVWTLALEEQFYLVWPALILWLGRKRLVPLCLATIFLALATRDGSNWILPKYDTERLLLSRCDGFALGGLLACWLEPDGWARRRRDLASWLFGMAIVLTVIYFAWGCRTYHSVPFIGLPTPMYPAETIFAFAILYGGSIGLVALHSGARWLAPLRNRGLVYVGQISYGLYLYHYVVYWVIDGCHLRPDSIRTGQDWKIQLGKLAASLVVAAASWHLIERPILGLKDRFRYRAEPSADLSETRQSR